MTWTYFDDGFAEHPKVVALTDAAFRLHVAGICHAARYLTDGYIGADTIPLLVPRYRTRTLDELVDRGLWLPAPYGFRIHDYLDYHRSRAEIEAARDHMREVRSKAGDKGARKRWGERGKPSDDEP